MTRLDDSILLGNDPRRGARAIVEALAQLAMEREQAIRVEEITPTACLFSVPVGNANGDLMLVTIRRIPHAETPWPMADSEPR